MVPPPVVHYGVPEGVHAAAHVARGARQLGALGRRAGLLDRQQQLRAPGGGAVLSTALSISWRAAASASLVVGGEGRRAAHGQATAGWHTISWTNRIRNMCKSYL